MKLNSRNRRNTFVDVTDRASLLGSRKKSDMMVLLEREDGKYTAGETVRGRVHIILTQDVSVKDLVVQFYGCGRVSWDESHTSYIKAAGSSSTVSCRNIETYLDHSLSLFENSASTQIKSSRTSLSAADDGLVLAAGSHGFQFDYTLPSDLPGTFQGRCGEVKYAVKATLRRPGRFDIEREAEMTVCAQLDLNDDIDLARPIGGLDEFNPGLMCFRSGPISIELRVYRRGYVPGDRIQLSADVENTSAYKLRHCRLVLTQHVTFRSGRKVRKTSNCVASVQKEDVLPRTTARWHNESVAVPQDLPASTTKSQRNIDVRYTLAVQLRYSRWSNAFSLPVTVVVGTVPLRRHRVNSYISAAMFSHSGATAPPTADADDTHTANNSTANSAIPL